MRNLIQLGVEELQSLPVTECVRCNELRRGLKEALMYSLLASTWTHFYCEATAQTRLRNAEINLTFALKDLGEHRRDAHSVDHFSAGFVRSMHQTAS